MNKIKGSVIGLGKMGISHAAIIGAHPDVDLISVCDKSSFILSGFKEFTNIATYRDYKKMIDNEKLDFTIVATPTILHYPMVKYALDKALHVFCEKPFMLNTIQGSELAENSMKKNLINQVGYHNHFVGTFIELKRLLSENILGNLVHFSGEAYGPVILKKGAGTWRTSSKYGGGCLFEYASHVINLIQEIIGRPKNVHGTLLKSIYSKGVEDSVYSLLELNNGLSGVLQANWSDETYRKMSTSLTIYGEKGKITCDPTEIKIFLKEPSISEKLNKGWTIKYITDVTKPVNYFLRGEEYSAQIDYFLNCIKLKRQAKNNSFEQGLYTDKVIELIIENAKMTNNG